MGKVSRTRIVIVISLILATGVLSRVKSQVTIERRETFLSQALIDIGLWECVSSRQLGEELVAVLDLDDYAYLEYKKKSDTVSLYVGYYYSSLKIGAAHDPMVCFPGQGWNVSHRSTGRVNTGPAMDVSYSMMMAQLGMKKELVVYWFQSYKRSNTSTFAQKVSLIWEKIIHNRGDNAFVRVTIPAEERTIEECQELANRFIKDFYPVFLSYIES